MSTTENKVKSLVAEIEDLLRLLEITVFKPRFVNRFFLPTRKAFQIDRRKQKNRQSLVLEEEVNGILEGVQECPQTAEMEWKKRKLWDAGKEYEEKLDEYAAYLELEKVNIRHK